MIESKPDILECLANLSSDEVFTPPKLANTMLDTLPQELFANPEARFLDPACKSGVFLREIAKRLIIGLEPHITDPKERLEHILRHQLYGLALTELTALLSRRTLYCAKNADSKLSLVRFDTPQGNIFYNKELTHTFEKGKCIYCRASESGYARSEKLESHAYAFIHPNPTYKELESMHFDVIIGNPPYQLDDGGAGASASPIYDKFIEQAKKFKPKHLVMIIPARWYSGGKYLDDFRTTMLHDTHIRELHDFSNASDCFDNVEIKGGVCYFHWDSEYRGECEVYNHKGDSITSKIKRPLLEQGCDTFIRRNESIPILHKVLAKKEPSIAETISSRRPFGMDTSFSDYVEEKDSIHPYKCYLNGGSGYIESTHITRNHEWIGKHKVLIPKAVGDGSKEYLDEFKPLYAEPDSVCTETYIVIGVFDTEQEARNLISYIHTSFFRFLVSLKKNTQDATRKVYSFVPLQDFSKPWSDEELYNKYGLDSKEIAFIQSLIKPMS